MASINQNRWDQLVRRVAGLIGPGSKVNNTIGDLFPMLDVENLPGELYLLAGTRLGFGGALQIAAAGEAPRVQLFNPANSGLLVTLTSLVISTNAIAVIRLITTATAASTNTLNQRVRDTRLGDITRTTAEIRSESNVAVLAADAEYRTIANVPVVLADPNGVVVLAPGSGLTVTNTSAASQVTVSFFWRERTAEQSELQF